MMATYFNGGSEIQADNLQTLYLMNRGYAAYSDASQPPPGVLFVNNGGGGNSASAPNGLAHQGSIHNQQHHLVGIPLAGSTSPGDHPSRSSLHENSTVGSSAAVLHGQLVPRFHYNLWGGGGGGGDPSPAGVQQIPTAIAVSAGGELGSPMGFRLPAPVTLAARSSTSTLDHHQHNHHQQGGLSLSLNNSFPHKNATARTMAVLSPGSGTPTSASGVWHGGAPSMIVGSKFLKAAQQLLDEVVNVGKAIHSKTDGSTKDKAKAAAVGTGGEGSSGCGESGGTKGSAELTTTQRQELQMKKAKLLNMLDEVEQRYRQYHSQMQMVAASFEQAAGEGSAKSYTALALQTISKQFRCLKDAIASQIKATGESMGEEEDDDEEAEAGEGKARSRLRMVDHQLRQQRALQQLGMIHHNAWRPQRGLPERAVSVLRAWLFEHFLHPYPKDSDKHMLAKQTGLTRSQVSNWFINARVRLWKPMVEEMYVEEMKSQEQNGSDNNHTTTNTNANDHNKDVASPKSTGPLHSRHGHNHNFNPNPQELRAPNEVVSNPTMTTLLSPSSSNGPALQTVGPLQGFSLSEMDPMMGQRSPKRQRMMINSDVIPTTTILTSMDKLEMKPGGRDLFPPDLTGFGSYPIGEIGSRFNPDHHQQHHQYHQGNAVSLTLGLPHDCDQNLSLSATHQQSYFPGHGQAVQLLPHSASAGGGYEEMNDVQNRKRFAALAGLRDVVRTSLIEVVVDDKL